MGKCLNAFFSETANMIKAKLYMNVHWMVLYNLKVFYSDMKFKMAATAGLSLTLDPMGKMFQNASSLKLLGQLKPNCPRMIIGRSSTNFCFLCRSEIQDGHHRRTYKHWTLWENVQMPSSQKLQIWLKPNCTWMFIGWSSTILRFFVLIWNSKWRLRQDLV